MTESKHTPGPWRMGGTSNPDAIGPMQSGLNGGTTILPIAIMGVDLSTNRKGANARLIAAAPDLLSALENLTKMVADGDWTTIELSEARAAISKATGEGN